MTLTQQIETLRIALNEIGREQERVSRAVDSLQAHQLLKQFRKHGKKRKGMVKR